MLKRKSSGTSNGRYSMEKYSSFDDLPREIVVEIMFRLPLESLMRLKSLNKSSNFLIQCLIVDPDFMAKHQRHAEENPETLLVNDPPVGRCLKIPPEMKTGLSKLRPQRLRSTFITRLIDNGGADEGSIHCVTENIDVSHLPNSLTRDRRSNFEVYHCNGIICFTKASTMKIFTLYSPVTGKFETFQPKPVRGVRDILICGMGFGSDPVGNNFKVVRILDSMRAHIFTPGASDSWREINMSIQDRYYHHMYEHVYLKGYCFWSAFGDILRTILCFDVCNEAFREITLPDELDAVRGNFRLTAVDDSLCWFSYLYKEPIDVWVMDINSFSWRKWLRIKPFEGFESPLTF